MRLFIEITAACTLNTCNINHKDIPSSFSFLPLIFNRWNLYGRPLANAAASECHFCCNSSLQLELSPAGALLANKGQFVLSCYKRMFQRSIYLSQFRQVRTHSFWCSVLYKKQTVFICFFLLSLLEGFEEKSSCCPNSILMGKNTIWKCSIKKMMNGVGQGRGRVFFTWSLPAPPK